MQRYLKGPHVDAAAAQQLDDLALAAGAHAALGGHDQVLGALVGQPHCQRQAKPSQASCDDVGAVLPAACQGNLVLCFMQLACL